MMMKLICMVNGIKLQNPSPNAPATAGGDAPLSIAAMATITTASAANENASGNQRSDQAHDRSAMRDSKVVELACAVMASPEHRCCSSHCKLGSELRSRRL